MITAYPIFNQTNIVREINSFTVALITFDNYIWVFIKLWSSKSVHVSMKVIMFVWFGAHVVGHPYTALRELIWDSNFYGGETRISCSQWASCSIFVYLCIVITSHGTPLQPATPHTEFEDVCMHPASKLFRSIGCHADPRSSNQNNH